MSILILNTWQYISHEQLKLVVLWSHKLFHLHLISCTAISSTHKFYRNVPNLNKPSFQVFYLEPYYELQYSCWHSDSIKDILYIYIWDSQCGWYHNSGDNRKIGGGAGEKNWEWWEIKKKEVIEVALEPDNFSIFYKIYKTKLKALIKNKININVIQEHMTLFYLIVQI